jgi:hypothetical protein
MKRLAPRAGASSARALASQFPDVKHREILETVVHDIGMDRLGFDAIRKADFGERYGLPAAKTKRSGVPGTATKETRPRGADGAAKTQATKATAVPSAAQRALATGDPRAVKRLLRDFTPRGKRREKLVALKNEIVQLDITKTPLAFCFVLRSMFEISAKVYCADHTPSGGPSLAKATGEDRHLVDVLRDITKHLTKNNSDRALVKELHGAMSELGKSNGILSVTSMNQLVHNPRFSVSPSDLATVFANIFPLLEEMNG